MKESDTVAPGDVPVCVWLTPSLLPNEVAAETFLSLVKRRPLTALKGFVWRVRGAERFRREVACRASDEFDAIVYDQHTLDVLGRMRSEGRSVVLLGSGSPELIRRAAGRLDAVTDIVARPSVADVADEVHSRFGTGGFDLLSRRGNGGPLAPTARRVIEVEGDAPRPTWRHLVAGIRVHQWLKNVLVFLPVLAGQELTDPGSLVAAVLAFFAFSFVASSVYVVNDLLDIQEDRLHPTKRRRPFAAGTLSFRTALPLLVGLLGAATLIAALLLPPLFSGVLAGYGALTLAYSLKLKGAVLIDVLTLAILYTVRILAGAAATGIQPSVWLVGFSFFFFTSLAMVKRYAELHRTLSDGAFSEGALGRGLPGRSYRPGDLPVLIALGVGTGCVSVMVLALYIISDEFTGHYRNPVLLWQLCPLVLYWIGRAWIVVSRDEMDDDPVVWALSDQLSRWVAFVAVLFLILAR